MLIDLKDSIYLRQYKYRTVLDVVFRASTKKCSCACHGMVDLLDIHNQRISRLSM